MLLFLNKNYCWDPPRPRTCCDLLFYAHETMVFLKNTIILYGFYHGAQTRMSLGDSYNLLKTYVFLTFSLFARPFCLPNPSWGWLGHFGGIHGAPGAFGSPFGRLWAPLWRPWVAFWKCLGRPGASLGASE